MVRSRRWMYAIAAALFACGGALAFSAGRAASAPGDISTVAGGDATAFPIDQIRSARDVRGVAFDGTTMFVSLFTDSSPNPSAIIERDLTTQAQQVIAGNSAQGGFSGDGGPAVDALLDRPGALSVYANALYLADGNNNRVRKIDRTTHIITTYAGNGDGAGSGDGGPATAAGIGRPTGLAFDAGGNLYIATSLGDVRKVDTSGDISTVLSIPSGKLGGLAFDAGGNLYVANAAVPEVVRVDPTFAAPTTVVGASDLGTWTAANACASASYGCDMPVGLGADGAVYVGAPTDPRATPPTNAKVVRYDPGSSAVSAYIGDGSESCRFTGSVSTVRGVATAAIALGPSNELYLAGSCAYWRSALLRVDPIAGTVVDVYGANPPNGDGGPATAAALSSPTDAVRVRNALYVAEAFGNRVRKVDLDTGVITTIAGDGLGASTGDGGPAVNARLLRPSAIAAAPDGSALYIGGWFDARIRRIDLVTGTISTIAGDGLNGYSGDGGPATSARIGWTSGIFVTDDGRIYFTASDTGLVRCIGCDGAGVISTVVGRWGASQYADGFPADQTLLFTPWDVVIAPDGAIVWSEANAGVVRRVDPVSGLVETVAGQYLNPGYSGDGGPATAATLTFPTGLRYDAAGNLYVADLGSSTVRRVSVANGVISTIAGTGVAGHSGDGGPAVNAQLASPIAMAADAGTHLYVVEGYPGAIRRIERDRPDLVAAANDVRTSPGSEVALAVQVSNDGEGYATGPVTADFTLPSSLTYVRSDSTGWSCDGSGGAVHCEYDSAMEDGAVTDATITVRASSTATGAPVVPVAVTSDSDDANPNNQSASIRVEIDITTTTTAAPETTTTTTTTATSVTVVDEPGTEGPTGGTSGRLPVTGGGNTTMRFVGIAMMVIAVGMVMWRVGTSPIFYRPRHRVPLTVRAARRIHPRFRR